MSTTLKLDSHRAFDTARYFPSLDGVRAICVLLVMFNHIPASIQRPNWVYGYLGVDVFFVLSGFLISTLLLRELALTGRIALGAFYCRRFFRIVPVYLVAVALYFVAIRATHDAVKAAQFRAALPRLLTFMQEYRPVAAGNILGHSWTLGIEEKFYACWPLMLLIINPQRVRALAAQLALCVLVSILPFMYARSYGGLLIGAMLAFALSAPYRRWVFSLLEHVPDALLALILAVAYLWAGHDDRMILLFSAAIASLMASLLLRDGLIRRVLETRALVFIGRRSYAMYLIHVLVADAVGTLSPSILPPYWLAAVSVSYGFSLAGASILYVTVERPCIAYSRRLSARLSARNCLIPGVDQPVLRHTL